MVPFRRWPFPMVPESPGRPRDEDPPPLSLPTTIRLFIHIEEIKVLSPPRIVHRQLLRILLPCPRHLPLLDCLRLPFPLSRLHNLPTPGNEPTRTRPPTLLVARGQEPVGIGPILAPDQLVAPLSRHRRQLSTVPLRLHQALMVAQPRRKGDRRMHPVPDLLAAEGMDPRPMGIIHLRLLLSLELAHLPAHRRPLPHLPLPLRLLHFQRRTRLKMRPALYALELRRSPHPFLSNPV